MANNHSVKRKIIRKDQKGNDFNLAEGKRISFNDEFELAYLRWRYLLKVENPSDEVIKSYTKVINKITHEAISRYKWVLYPAGMEFEDIASICQTHLVSYIGLFSIEHNEEEKAKYVENHIRAHGYEPSENDIRQKDVGQMIAFLRQRIMDFVRICGQKNRSVIPSFQDGGLYELVGEEKDGEEANLIENPSAYGFKPVTLKEEAFVRSQVVSYGARRRFELNGKVYRIAYRHTSTVYFDDIQKDQNSSENSNQNHDLTMVRSYAMSQQDQDPEGTRAIDQYEKMDKEDKINLIKYAKKHLIAKDDKTKINLANKVLDMLRSSE